MSQITIQIGKSVFQARLRDTPTAAAIYAQLPIQSKAQTWGDEVYFAIPLNTIALEGDAKDVVELGELAFWVEGSCIAIGFGPTPISQAGEIRLAAKTNIWADTQNDLKILKNILPGESVCLSASETYNR